MSKHFITLFFCVLVVFACDKKEQKEAKVITKKPEMSIAVKHTISSPLDAKTEKKIGEWKEYADVKEFLSRFENISPNQALSNALELKDLAKKLKDSIRIEELKTPAFKARVNVLENETLRLADMTYIPAITPNEVNGQVKKMFLVFGSLNAKIKAHYQQKSLDKDLNLDSFLVLDSTELRKPTTNTLPKQPKDLNKKELLKKVE